MGQIGWWECFRNRRSSRLYKECCEKQTSKNEFVPSVSSDSCSWHTRVELDVVLCCCSLKGVCGSGVLSILKCFSAYHDYLS